MVLHEGYLIFLFSFDSLLDLLLLLYFILVELAKSRNIFDRFAIFAHAHITCFGDF